MTTGEDKSKPTKEESRTLPLTLEDARKYLIVWLGEDSNENRGEVPITNDENPPS